MRIGELAFKTDCDVQTVRYYEREGLLEEPRRSEAGYRDYEARHVHRLLFIRRCRALGLPLVEVRHLLQLAETPDESCASVNALVDQHIADVRTRLVELNALEQQLLDLRSRCQGGSPGVCPILGAMVDTDGLERASRAQT